MDIEIDSLSAIESEAESEEQHKQLKKQLKLKNDIDRKYLMNTRFRFKMKYRMPARLLEVKCINDLYYIISVFIITVRNV